jgi:hypothetical protein
LRMDFSYNYASPFCLYRYACLLLPLAVATSKLGIYQMLCVQF